MSNELVPVVNKSMQQEFGMTLTGLAEHLLKSKFFNCNNVSQAISKIIMGRAMGIDPGNSLMGIYIGPGGKLCLSANLMANRIKATGKYRWILNKHDKNECSGTVYEKMEGKWEEVGKETVTYKDFEHLAAKNQTWKQYPKNMLFARWISNVAKFYCPDAFGGSAVYLPDEIPDSGFKVNGDTLEVIEDAEFEVKEGEYEDLVKKLGLSSEELSAKLGLDKKVIEKPTEEQREKILKKLQLLQEEKENE